MEHPSPQDPNEHVSGFYGPGAMASWLLCICSTVVSWTLNKEYHKKDIISMDMLPSLAIPAVAAGHMTVSYIQGEEFQPPMAVCHLFSTLGFLLLLLAHKHQNWLKAAAVASVTAPCAVLARLGWGASRSDAKIDALFLMLCVLLILNFTPTTAPPKPLCWQLLENIWAGIGLAWVCLRTVRVTVALFIFLSPYNSIKDLDQAFAMAIGLVALGFSGREAFKSRKRGGFD